MFDVFKKATNKIIKKREGEELKEQKAIAQNYADVDLLNGLVLTSKIGVELHDNRPSHVIYVKPGMYNNKLGVSNIDFVQAIYAEHGIYLEKDYYQEGETGERTVVLHIPLSARKKLDAEKVMFLIYTSSASSEMKSREKKIIEKILNHKTMQIGHER